MIRGQVGKAWPKGPLFGFGFGYLVGRAPKLGHCTDELWCVNNLPKVVT